MEKFNYLDSIFMSVKEVLTKPILLVPFLVSVILGILFEVWNIQFTENPIDFTVAAGGGALALFLIGYIIYVLLLIFTTGMGLGAMKHEVEKKDTSVMAQVRGGANMFWRILGLYFVQGLIIFVPVALVAFLIMVAVTPPVNLFLLLLAIVIAFAVLAFFIFLVLAFFYASVNIAYGTGPINALKFSYRAMRQNTKHVVFSFLSMLLLVIIVIIVIVGISIMVGIGIGIGNPEAAEEGIPLGVQVVFNGITSLIMMPFSAAMTLYIFRSFKALPVKKPDFYPKVK